MKKGTKVSWTHVSQRGRTLSMILRKGVIDSIDNDYAIIRKSNGKTERVALARLRTEGQKSQITEFIEIMRTAHQRRQT